jgi:hypothetical protein
VTQKVPDEHGRRATALRATMPFQRWLTVGLRRVGYGLLRRALADTLGSTWPPLAIRLWTERRHYTVIRNVSEMGFD